MFELCSVPVKEDVKLLSIDRLNSVIAASGKRGDEFAQTVINLKELRKTLACHRSCVSTYTSQQQIDRCNRKRKQEEKQHDADNTKTGGVEKMLSGKSFPQNCTYVQKKSYGIFYKMMAHLNGIAK